MVSNTELSELLLAINMNSKLNIQLVVTYSFSNKTYKRIRSKFGIEFMKRTKVLDEETNKNKYVMRVYRNEVYSSKDLVYKRLGEIYQERVARR